MSTTRQCSRCGRPVLSLRIFADEVVVDAHRRCFRIVRDPATGRPLVQEAPGYYAEHECEREPSRPWPHGAEAEAQAEAKAEAEAD